MDEFKVTLSCEDGVTSRRGSDLESALAEAIVGHDRLLIGGDVYAFLARIIERVADIHHGEDGVEPCNSLFRAAESYSRKVNNDATA